MELLIWLLKKHNIKEEDVRMDGKRFAKYFLDKVSV